MSYGDTLSELIAGCEPLVAPLAKHEGAITRGGWNMPAVRHPLIYSVPHSEAFNKVLNNAFQAKRDAIRTAKGDRALSRYAVLYERAYRVDAIHNFLRKVRGYGSRPGEDGAFWQAVAWAHTDSENILADLAKWTRLWTAPPGDLLRSRHLASDADDLKRLASLGDRIEVFHGNSASGKFDLSWTLDYNTAAWFAHRFGEQRPVVYHGLVNRSDVIAYLTRRGEDEIVVQSKHVEVRHIEALKPKRISEDQSLSSALIQATSLRP